MTDAQWWRMVTIRAALTLIGLGAGAATALAAVDLAATKATERVCARVGCEVPSPARSALTDGPAAEYVSLCEDSNLTGPCVQSDPGGWWYIASGAHYPAGRVRIDACRVETGGPVPCVWVPSMMGEHHNMGDSGAYVYR